MLRKIRLKNFKLHEDTSIEASRITVFIGPNNSGKSSIFQALLMWRQARGGQEYVPTSRGAAHGDEVVDIGEFGDVVRYGEREITLGLSGSIAPRRPAKNVDAVETSFDAIIHDNRLIYHEGYFRNPSANFKWKWASGATTGERFRYRLPGGEVSVNPSAALDLLGGAVLLEQSSHPSAEDYATLQDVADFYCKIPSLLLDSLQLIPALRGFEERGYHLASSPSNDLRRLTLAQRAEAIVSMLAYDREREEAFSHQLEALTGTGIRVKLVPGPRGIVETKRSDVQNLFVNEGTGANQLPFILIPLAIAPKGETILMLEPEAHLHPKKQSELTAMLLEVSRKADLQFFIETHSEHVLHRLLHAVAKGELLHDDLAIYYFENKHGKAEARKLAIDEKGGIEGGLPGFFDQSLDELSEYLQALKEPKA